MSRPPPPHCRSPPPPLPAHRPAAPGPPTPTARPPGEHPLSPTSAPPPNICAPPLLPLTAHLLHRARLSSDSDPEEGDGGLFPFPLPKEGGSRGSSEDSEEEGAADDAHRPDCHYAARPPRPQAVSWVGRPPLRCGGGRGGGVTRSDPPPPLPSTIVLHLWEPLGQPGLLRLQPAVGPLLLGSGLHAGAAPQLAHVEVMGGGWESRGGRRAILVSRCPLCWGGTELRVGCCGLVGLPAGMGWWFGGVPFGKRAEMWGGHSGQGNRYWGRGPIRERGSGRDPGSGGSHREGSGDTGGKGTVM